MDEKIRHQLKINNIREMKKPTILMNDKDLENFSKELETKVVNFKAVENPTYEGIPIIAKGFIESGIVIIYDAFDHRQLRTLAHFSHSELFNP